MVPRAPGGINSNTRSYRGVCGAVGAWWFRSRHVVGHRPRSRLGCEAVGHVGNVVCRLRDVPCDCSCAGAGEPGSEQANDPRRRQGDPAAVRAFGVVDDRVRVEACGALRFQNDESGMSARRTPRHINECRDALQNKAFTRDGVTSLSDRSSQLQRVLSSVVTLRFTELTSHPVQDVPGCLGDVIGKFPSSVQHQGLFVQPVEFGGVEPGAQDVAAAGRSGSRRGDRR